MNYPQRENATDVHGSKTKLQEEFSMKAVNSDVDKKENTFPDGKFGRSHQIYPNHCREIISNVQLTRTKLTRILIKVIS